MVTNFWEALIWGLIIGGVFGFILQRGRYCMNSAFRDIIVLKDFKLAKAVTVSLGVLMVGFSIFDFAGGTLNPNPFRPLAAIIGGSVFGIGMVLAAGCASGTTYRTGEGMMGSFVAAVGLTTGALMTAFGPLNSAMAWLRGVVDLGQVTLFGMFDPTNILAPIMMIIIGIVGLVLMFVFWGWPAIKKKREANEKLIKTENFVESTFKKGWPWWVTGIAIGIILTIGLIVFESVVGITGGWMDVNLWITTQDPVTWTGFIIFGAILGAFASALIAKEFKFRIPKEGFTVFKQFLGGGLMGFGAVTAMGCNITNILGGVPQFSLHSILTGACIVAGCWLAAYLLFMWRKE